MLPRLTGHKDFEDITEENCYTVITSEWKQIDENKNILLPTFHVIGNVEEMYTKELIIKWNNI